MKGRIPVAADTLEIRLKYALRLSGGTMPQVIIVRDEAERRKALAFLKDKPGGNALRIQTQAENTGRHRRQ